MSSMAIARCWSCGTVCDHPDPKIKWREESLRCLQSPGYVIAQRVCGIAFCFMPRPERNEYSPEVVGELEDEEDVLERKKDLLDELQLYDVESIDVASVLHSEGLLFSFLCHALSNKHACIRAKAAEVITTMVKKNPKSHQLLIEGNVLQPLLYNFSSDPYVTSKTKALGAISALIQQNKSGITVFQRENGYAALRNTLISESVCQRSTIYKKVVYLIVYLLRENNLYYEARDLEFADDSEVQEAALNGLLLLAERKGGNSGQLVKDDDKPKQVVLQELPSAALPIVQKKKKKTS